MTVVAEGTVLARSPAPADSIVVRGITLAQSAAALERELPESDSAAKRPSVAPIDSTRHLLDGVPLPTLLLASDRRLVMRNAAAEANPSAMACLGVYYGRVTCFAGASTEPFERVFVRALNGFAAGAVVTLAKDGRQLLWRVCMGPLRSPESSLDAALIMVVDPPASMRAALVALRRLFGVTAAEARVLGLLLDDCRPREIAERLDVSITTVRSHLKALYAKTGKRRQSELVTLAWSAAVPLSA